MLFHSFVHSTRPAGNGAVYTLAPPGRRARTVCQAGTAAPGLQQTGVLESKHFSATSNSGHTVHVVGLDHLKQQDDVGEFILRTRPACVVLETAMSAQFGTATGNLLTAQDADAQRSDQVMLRMLFAMSDALSRHSDPLASDEWKQMKGQIPCEQLGAVAGLAVGAALMYGDRPKPTTYRRLMHCCTTEELDASFGRRSARNTRDILSALGVSTSDESDIAEVASGATGTADSVERVLLTEREAVLCHSAHAAAAQCKDKSDSVVVLTGESHLDTMQRMLKTSSWQGLAGHGDRAAADTTTTTTSSSSSGGSEAWRKSAWGEPPADAQIEGRWGAGVHRALAESVLALRAPWQVVAELQQVLGPVPESDQEAYEATAEIYGTCRMLLAPLDRELLSKVVTGVGGEFWELLEPLRLVRPINGGPGYDLDLLQELRGLNFELG